MNNNNKLELLEKKIEYLENKLQLLENIIMQNTIKNFDHIVDNNDTLNTELNFDNENINRSINVSENTFVNSPPNLQRQYGFELNN